MASYRIFKETSLPATLVANGIYIIAPASTPDYAELYVTDNAGNAVRRLPTKADIDALIETAVSDLAKIEVVSDITARDALATGSTPFQVFVIDATGDTTVDSGAATYIWRPETSQYTKISEAESMDVTINWADIVGKPSSSPSAIDDAVAKAHTHANKTELDKVGENAEGFFTYNGIEYVLSGSTSW